MSQRLQASRSGARLSRMGPPPRSESEFAATFWERVDRSGGADACWPWTRGRDRDGYGMIWRHRTNLRTHRTALLLSGVAVSDDEFVCHRCDNPPCCNPRHLFVGTPADNVLDCNRKGRAWSPRGEDAYWAKLSERDVRQIRRRRSAGEKASLIAADFGVSESNVRMIASGKTWRHLLSALRAGAKS